jgi:hypothetical protein
MFMASYLQYGTGEALQALTDAASEQLLLLSNRAVRPSQHHSQGNFKVLNGPNG